MAKAKTAPAPIRARRLFTEQEKKDQALGMAQMELSRYVKSILGYLQGICGNMEQTRNRLLHYLETAKYNVAQSEVEPPPDVRNRLVNVLALEYLVDTVTHFQRDVISMTQNMSLDFLTSEAARLNRTLGAINAMGQGFTHPDYLAQPPYDSTYVSGFLSLPAKQKLQPYTVYITRLATLTMLEQLRGPFVNVEDAPHHAQRMEELRAHRALAVENPDSVAVVYYTDGQEGLSDVPPTLWRVTPVVANHG